MFPGKRMYVTLGANNLEKKSHNAMLSWRLQILLLAGQDV
jgi:hypothetical protein